MIFRVAQEALTNVARHAGADQVEFDLIRSAESVRLRVADNGRGIKGAAAGDGLRGMRERAGLVGGHLEVAARPEGGTEVCLDIPRGEPTV